MRYGFVTFEDVKDADIVIYHSIENLDGSKVSFKFENIFLTIYAFMQTNKNKTHHFNLIKSKLVRFNNELSYLFRFCYNKRTTKSSVFGIKIYLCFFFFLLVILNFHPITILNYYSRFS